jgi:hypothetical protein
VNSCNELLLSSGSHSEKAKVFIDDIQLHNIAKEEDVSNNL